MKKSILIVLVTLLVSSVNSTVINVPADQPTIQAVHISTSVEDKIENELCD